eukprot:3924408-Pleurochrysis_carterae.AAC.1
MQFHVKILPECHKTSAHDDKCNDVHTRSAAARGHRRYQKVVNMHGQLRQELFLVERCSLCVLKLGLHNAKLERGPGAHSLDLKRVEVSTKAIQLPRQNSVRRAVGRRSTEGDLPGSLVAVLHASRVFWCRGLSFHSVRLKGYTLN